MVMSFWLTFFWPTLYIMTRKFRPCLAFPKFTVIGVKKCEIWPLDKPHFSRGNISEITNKLVKRLWWAMRSHLIWYKSRSPNKNFPQKKMDQENLFSGHAIIQPEIVGFCCAWCGCPVNPRRQRNLWNLLPVKSKMAPAASKFEIRIFFRIFLAILVSRFQGSNCCSV